MMRWWLFRLNHRIRFRENPYGEPVVTVLPRWWLALWLRLRGLDRAKRRPLNSRNPEEFRGLS